eukprot:CAMPEP_0175123746 /NCGR_PEP_ID=MMETSP0087-20121206/2412_1 /TAXON_ID=136419 /ORGANISM="Unknown Unknown, Strain D1" /LENGTH=245 /DNA_ID=CAMNT_0016405467 /DNA_START=79 /DNA_END=816 /DNA_ORIENTATION=+
MPVARKILTVLIFFFSIYYCYLKITRRQSQQEELQRTRNNNQQQNNRNSAPDDSASRTNPSSKLSLSAFETYIATSHRHSVCLSSSVLVTRVADELVFKPDVLPILTALADSCTLMLVTKCPNHAYEREVLALLTKSGLFEVGLAKHRVLFCTKTKGQSSIVRQIQPDIYIDDDTEVVDALAPFIPRAVLVDCSTPASAANASKVEVSSCFVSFFAPPASCDGRDEVKTQQSRRRPAAAKSSSDL